MRNLNTWGSGREFEQDVIRIARSLWPNAGVGGAVVLESRERDGVFVTEEAVHIIECTISRAKQKAIDDVEKSTKLARTLRKEHPDRAVQCWIVTAEEPTPDQRAVALGRKEFPINILSYSSFRGRLIDASAYLNTRREYAFGSARNPKDGSVRLGRFAEHAA